ncbi:hypothetical protein ACF090_36680 [Streptomyces sp. NPDC014892]|uniref:hypothetical protein n=1 Tax=Streptomyces sp. NPDC014892 TaxID=3364930 RepID=UPI00370159E0
MTRPRKRRTPGPATGAGTAVPPPKTPKTPKVLEPTKQPQRSNTPEPPGSPALPKPNACDPPVGLPGLPVGALVLDRATGRVGTLRDVVLYLPADVLPGPDARPARRLAFLRPVGGGREWTTDVDQMVPASCSRTRRASAAEPD